MPIESLAVQIALEEVMVRVPTSRLSIEDARKAVGAARARVVLPTEVGPDPTKHEVLRPPIG